MKAAVLVIAGVAALTGCGSSDTASSTSTTVAPVTTSTAVTTSTTAMSQGHYIFVKSATTQGASVTISGNTATLTQSTAVDPYFEDSGKQVATVLAPSQPVSVLTAPGVTREIKASELAAYLPTDQWGNLYRLDGDVTAPEGLTEIYKQ